MKNILFCLFVLLLFTQCKEADKRVKEIIVCGDDKALIIDCQQSQGTDVKVLWEWSPKMVEAAMPEIYQKRLHTLDDCKPVNHGKQILMTASSGATVLVDVETKAPLFYSITPMAHSAELLPGGRIVVALSTHDQGNSIELYDQTKSEQCLYRDSLYSGHGVVWMEKQQILYALGFDELRAYTLENWETSHPSLRMQQSWGLPSEGGHDLVKISDKALLYTCHENVYQFDLETHTFSEFPLLAKVPHVKSVNYNIKTDEMIYTLAEESWWTHHIYNNQHPEPLQIDTIDLYKVRVIR